MEATGWQTTRSSIKERNEYMFNNSLLSDVAFLAGDDEGETMTIPAHKYVLSISSPVFEAMFYGELAETSSTISLPDCTNDGLLELLRYIYYDKIQLTGNNVMEVLYLARKYDIPSLANRCTQYIETELQPEDVFIVLPNIEKLCDENLREVCWELVDTETLRAVTSDAFLDVTQETLGDILERDALQISEVQLFEAVNRWAENKQEADVARQSKREVLGEELIRLIRFPLMEMDEFVETVLPLGILNNNEVTEMMTMFIYYSDFNDMLKCTLVKTFNAKERIGLPRREDSCKRFQAYRTGWRYGGRNVDRITFTTDKHVYLTGVKICGTRNRDHAVGLSLYKESQLLAIKNIQQRAEECFGAGQDWYYGFTINLDKPVFIHSETEYGIDAIINGPTSYYGESGEATVECENVTFRFKNKGKEKHTSVTRGQFPELLFYQYFK